jgi:hypothetical protein
MRPPRTLIREKVKLDTTDDFYDSDYGWVRRLSIPCPKCKHENTLGLLENHGILGCTHCSYMELAPGTKFLEGGYSEARKVFESLFDERRSEKPFQRRFIPMNFKRNN